MDARIPQALTRKHPSTIPASTVKPVAVSRTTKVVAVIQTSGSKDCFIRPSKIMSTPAKKQYKSWFISSRRIRRSVGSRPEAKSRVQSSQRAVEGNDQQHGKHGVLRDLRNHSQSTVPQLCDALDGRHWKLYLRDVLATLRQKFENQTRIAMMFCRFQTPSWRPISRCTSRKHTGAKKPSRSPCVKQKRQRKMATNRYWIDS